MLKIPVSCFPLLNYLFYVQMHRKKINIGKEATLDVAIVFNVVWTLYVTSSYDLINFTIK